MSDLPCDDKNSETPRTDAFVRSYAGVECYRIVPNLTDLARQLERELAESKRDVNTLNETLRLAGWGQGEIDSTAADVQERLEASAPSADGRGQPGAVECEAQYPAQGGNPMPAPAVKWCKRCQCLLPDGSVCAATLKGKP